jgi:hypothetical protein
MATLDPSEHEWFAAHARSALVRRDEAWFRTLRWRWLEWLLTGLVGLFGLAVLDWTATTAALLLLASHWLGWLLDVVQWLLRGPEIRVARAQDHDDMRAWQLVDVMRGRRSRPPQIGSDPALGLSIAVDLVAGAVASVLALQGLQRDGVDLAASLGDDGALVALALLVIGSLAALRTRLRRRDDGSVALPVFRVGQRGIGLLVLVFGVMGAGGGSLVGRWMVGAVYVFFVLMGALQLAVDLPHLRAATDWLRREIERADPRSP